MSSSASMTIVVLNDFCSPNGGASRVAIDEAVSLAGAGFRTLFFGAVGPVCSELASSSARVICLDQPELVSALEHPAVALQAIWNRAAAQRLEAELASLDPARTVVHVHGYGKALSASAISAASARGFSLVCTLHDYFSVCPNGGLFNYVTETPCPKRGMSLACLATNCDKRHYLHKLYRVGRSAVHREFGGFPSSVSNFIVLSARSRDLLRPQLPRAARYFPLRNMVPVQRTEPVAVDANEEIVAVGRLDPEKGIGLLLEACRELGMKLTLIGDGPLRARAEATPGVRVTGWLSREDVLAQLRRGRCLAFPSLWYETYGLVVDEAAAMGIPSIVSDVTAAAERIEHGASGWKFKSGDREQLKACLMDARDNAKLRAIGRSAYEHFWRDPPTSERHLEHLREIYEAILTTKENGHSSEFDS